MNDYNKDVRSDFDARPVDGVDTLLIEPISFEGIIELRVPTGAACPIAGNNAPLSPWDQDFGNNGIAPNSGMATTASKTFNACTQFSVHTTVVGSPSGVRTFLYALSSLGPVVAGTYNAFGYVGTTATNGTLVDSNLGFTMPTAAFAGPFTNTLVLNLGLAVVGQHYTAIITGATGTDIATNIAIGSFFIF